MSERTHIQQSRRGLALLGVVLLYTGAAFVFYLVIARTPRSGVPLPAFLYRNRDLWLVVGGLIVAAGMVCLRRSSPPSVIRDATPFSSVVLYTRSDCPLCEEALEVLQRHRERLPGIEIVDIGDEPELVVEFGDWVPVVEIDGTVRFRGCVDEMLLRRLLDAAARDPLRQPHSEPTT